MCRERLFCRSPLWLCSRRVCLPHPCNALLTSRLYRGFPSVLERTPKCALSFVGQDPVSAHPKTRLWGSESALARALTCVSSLQNKCVECHQPCLPTQPISEFYQCGSSDPPVEHRRG